MAVSHGTRSHQGRLTMWEKLRSVGKKQVPPVLTHSQVRLLSGFLQGAIWGWCQSNVDVFHSVSASLKFWCCYVQHARLGCYILFCTCRLRIEGTEGSPHFKMPDQAWRARADAEIQHIIDEQVGSILKRRAIGSSPFVFGSSDPGVR